jgi:hypothetical protein
LRRFSDTFNPTRSSTMRSLSTSLLLCFLAIGLCAMPARAQDRPASPRGEVSTQVGGSWDNGGYTGGKWIVIDYGRPILRGRTGMFGEGDNYGEAVKSGAPVWRAGANQSTMLMTETDLMLGSAHLPAGSYTLFIEPDADAWTLIISNHKAKPSGNSDMEGIWGAYNYDAGKDVLRAKMTLSEAPFSVDQLTFSFVNMTQAGGTLAVMWEKELATIDFMAH